jgi:glycosyltransferase involved in cell wall biosynthesis
VCLTPPGQRVADTAHSYGMVSELASWLHRNDWPVEIVAGNVGPPDPDRTADATLPGLGTQSGLGSSPEVIGMGYRLKRLSPWLVHSFDIREAVAAQVSGAPHVLSLQQIPGGENFSCRPIAHTQFEAALRGAKSLICPNHQAAKQLADVFGFFAFAIPEGVDTQRLRDVPRRATGPVVVCPADGVAGKHLELLVDAFVRVAETIPGIRLVIVGKLDRDGYVRLVDRVPAALRRQLSIFDGADHRKTVSLLARASLTCMPSPSPVSSRVLVESLAVGTPVACADGGTATEVINEDAVAACAGMRFAAGDVEGCARCIVKVLELSQVEGVEDACRARAELYDWSFIGPRLLEVYRQAVA